MQTIDISILTQEAVALLQQLIATPSISRQEDKTAEVLRQFLAKQQIPYHTFGNNVWAYNIDFDQTKPTLLLNSHHDTVKPNQGYTRDPFTPTVQEGKLFGLGSNDAGGSLVSLLATFQYFYEKKNLPYNLVWAGTAEEEISGKNGVASILHKLPNLALAIVGEPTQMNLAIAEKGLMVLDCYSYGKSGHAARNEGENAIYKALPDITWFQTFQFPRVSEALGPVKMSVTMIDAGKQHNVVPDLCHFVVDVRTTDAYSNAETLAIIQQKVRAEVKPRSLRLNPSGISADHPLVLAGKKLGRRTFGSPTLSDQALMPFPSVKIGPGDSARSHTADEFIYLREIEEGITLYIELFELFFKSSEA